ncbi:MAG: hypothetical protein IPP33_16860 [Flavobacteriales bacterium]|nr:hypothetical protein [Flavobacteriales bacterium]
MSQGRTVTKVVVTSWWACLLLWGALVSYATMKAPRDQFAWDCFGYQLYLPATFIHHDPFLRDLSWVEEARIANNSSGTLYQVSTFEDGSRVIKYPIGLAVTWLPWFLLGHGVAWIIGTAADGYSWPYQLCVSAGVFCYLLLGLFALRAVLLRIFNERVVVVALTLVVLGTNVVGQIITDLTMPHLTLFAVQCGVLYQTVRWYEGRRWMNAIALGLLLGLAALIRPTEIICVLIPLLWGVTSGLGTHIRTACRYWQQWVTIGAVILLVGFIQLLYWKSATGHWFVDPYNNPAEGLDFLSPYTSNFLFSYRKGWLLYTPIMVLGVLGLVLLPRKWKQASVADHAGVGLCLRYK